MDKQNTLLPLGSKSDQHCLLSSLVVACACVKSTNSIRSDRVWEVFLNLGPDPFLMGRIACENVPRLFQVMKRDQG